MLEYLQEEFLNAIYDSDQEAALSCIQKALECGISAEDATVKIVASALTSVSESLINRKAALSQHFMAVHISEKAIDELHQRFPKSSPKSGTVILGTAAGDFHGLGKKIVGGCLKAHLFEVVDLGLNVSSERYVDEALSKRANVIGVSSMMVHSALGEHGPKEIRTLLRERGLESQIKLIVGGAPYQFDEGLYQKTGADAWARDGVEAVAVIKRLFEEVTQCLPV